MPGGTLYLYHIPAWAMRMGPHLERLGLAFQHWIAISMKNGFVRGRRLYPAHYALLMFTKGKPKYFRRPKLKPQKCRHCGKYIKSYGGYLPIIEKKGINLSDFWEDVSPVRHKNTKHRTANELSSVIFERVVEISGHPNTLYVDPFVGSGSGVLASSAAGMRFAACDIVQENCSLVAERLKNYRDECRKGEHGGKSYAIPHKRFFIDMFTRDISLADCILDLIDNSIDGLIRTGRMKLSDALEIGGGRQPLKGRIPQVKLTLNSNTFSITDACGGMSYEYARDEAFNFGHPPESKRREPIRAGLGVYGVGLKRAVFKLGDSFRIESHSEKSGFTTDVKSLQEWIEQDTAVEDWSFPIERTPGVGKDSAAGTRLVVRHLHEEVTTLFGDEAFQSQLSSEIARVFAFFLEKFVRVLVNGVAVEPLPIAFGRSEEVKPAFKHLQLGKVDVYLYASLQMRDKDGEWRGETAGWYVACNGRLILVANKDAATGWGGGALPQYHSKYRGFLGLAHFVSENPYLLPWTTTKRGLNRESLSYQKAMNEMRVISRPVISFLVKMYAGDPAELKPEREVADRVKVTDVVQISMGTESNFEVKQARPKKAKTTIRVQYDAEVADLEKVRKHLRNPSLKANQVGALTFEDYLKRIS